MNKDYNRARATLVEISKDVDRKVYDSDDPQPLWEGADISIISRPNEDNGEREFYSEPRTVVTPFAGQAGWLLNRLHDSFEGYFDGTSRIEFYGRLAIAAQDYQRSVNGDENAQALLRAMLHEAFVILDELEQGEFVYSSATSGNTILADLINRAEESGYLGVEATEEFLRRMEEKHRET